MRNLAMICRTGGVTAALMLSAYAATSAPTINVSRILFGNDSEHAYAVAVDASGNSYVTGVTSSAYSFPLGTGATVSHGYKACSLNGYAGTCPNSAYVVKIDPAGNIIAQVLFGGIGSTQPKGIAVDGNSVYVVGATNSPAITTSAGRYPSVYYGYGATPSGANSRSFLAKFSATLDTLSTVTTLGAATSSEAHAIALDTSGTAYLTGKTCGAGSPATPGAFPTRAITEGSCDVFVAHLDYFASLSGNGPSYFARFGGYQEDTGNAIAVDATGAAWIAGRACAGPFPFTPGLSHATPNYCNAFVMKLDPSGLTYQYSMALGGSRTGYGDVPYYQEATTLILNGTSGVYVGGFTGAVDFPTLAAAGHSPLQATSACVQTAIPYCNKTGFVAYLDAGLNLVNSTYLGGANDSQVLGIAKNSRGEVFVTGNIFGNATGFPGANAAPFISTGGYAAKLSGSLESLGWTNLFAGPVTSIVARGNSVSTSLWTAGDTYPNRTYTDSFMIKMTDAIASSPVAPICRTCVVR